MYIIFSVENVFAEAFGRFLVFCCLNGSYVWSLVASVCGQSCLRRALLWRTSLESDGSFVVGLWAGLFVCLGCCLLRLVAAVLMSIKK